jgi:hypothetical protein
MDFQSLYAKESKFHTLVGQFFILAISVFFGYVVVRKPAALRGFSNLMGINTPIRNS